MNCEVKKYIFGLNKEKDGIMLVEFSVLEAPLRCTKVQNDDDVLEVN